MESKTLLISGLPTSYIESSGVGTPLIFLHGWGQNKEAFAKIYSELRVRKIAFFGVDFPGFGGTTLPKETWGVYDYADFICEFIAKKNIADHIVIGHSFGGRIGIVLASRKSTGMKKLILIGSAGIRPKTSLVRKLSISSANILLKLPGGSRLRPLIRDIFGSRDDKNAGPLREIFRKVIREDLEDLLRKIDIPTLLLWGSHDTETPLHDAEIMEKKIPNAKLKVFEGGTHFVYLEFPREVTEQILSFIE